MGEGEIIKIKVWKSYQVQLIHIPDKMCEEVLDCWWEYKFLFQEMVFQNTSSNNNDNINIAIKITYYASDTGHWIKCPASIISFWPHNKLTVSVLSSLFLKW